jgi:septum formation protein
LLLSKAKFTENLERTNAPSSSCAHYLGKTVNFFTGLCLLNAEPARPMSAASLRWLPSAQLSDAEIENYLRREPAYNCAGSAKVGRPGDRLLQSMRGDDPNALVGLPLIALCDMLRRQGMAVL